MKTTTTTTLRTNQLSPTPPAVAAPNTTAAGVGARSTASGGGVSAARSRGGGGGGGGGVGNATNKSLFNSTMRTTTTTTTTTNAGGGGGSTVFHPRVAASRGTTFLRDSEGKDKVLPMPLPRGMPFAAAFTSFEDLVAREILVQPEERRVYLSTQDARIIFEAKCMDQGLKPCWERELRFLELVSANCQGMLFALRENGLGQHSAAAIAHVLSKNIHFALLDLSGNKLATDGGFEVARMLEQNDSLVHLNLRSNDIGPEAVAAIADALSKNSTVTSLDLGGISGVSRNHIGTFGAKAIGEMLKVNQVLCMLNVSSSGLGAEGTRLISDGLHDNITLTHLDVSNNNISHVGCQKLCEVLAEHNLVRLDLSGNGLGDRGAKYVHRAYRVGTHACGHLTKLILEHNGIGPAGAAEIGKLLQSNEHIEYLSLSNNPLAEGIVEIADKMRENQSLRELHLQSCAINEEGAVAVAFALSKHNKLEILDLSKNRTGDPGARAFAAHLANKNERNATLTRLKFLDLSGSAIGNEGGMDLAKMVSENSTLVEMSLRQNLIGGNVGMAFDEAFKRSDCRLQPHGNVTLLQLDLSFNDIPFQAHSKIEASLARNRSRHEEGTIPRLKRKIEEMEEQQSELFSKESEIESERRANRDKAEEIGRRRDMVRAQADQNRRQIAELTEEVQASQAVHNQKKDELRAVEEKLNSERTKLEGKLTHLNHKVEIEREKRERVLKEIEKFKKQLKARADADDEFLKPHRDEFKDADNFRNRARTECKGVSEMLIQAQIEILKATIKQPGVLPNPAQMLGKAPPEAAAAAAASGGEENNNKAAATASSSSSPGGRRANNNNNNNSNNQSAQNTGRSMRQSQRNNNNLNNAGRSQRA